MTKRQVESCTTAISCTYWVHCIKQFTQSLSAINYLKCPLCLCILHRPVWLPCQSLVCAECIATCLTSLANNRYPCCHDNSPLTASSINAAPDVFWSLLSDILLLCNSCTTDISARAYRSHACNVDNEMRYTHAWYL